MKNTSKKIPDTEAVFTEKVVFDRNPDYPMYYFEFEYNQNKVLLSLEILRDTLYFGIEKQKLPGELFSWLVENNKIAR